MVSPSIALPGTAGYVPGNAIFSSSGNDGGDSAAQTAGSAEGAVGTLATNSAAGEDSAADAVNGLNLNKSLASQQQLSQLEFGNGINIAGNGTSVPLNDVSRLVSEYGGQASD